MTLTLQPGFKLEQYTLTKDLGPVMGANMWLATDAEQHEVCVRLADDTEVQIVFREQADSFEKIIERQPSSGACKVLACSPFGALPFTVEEYHPNAKSLKRIIQESAPMGQTQSRAFLIQLARAVQPIHQAGIVHGLIRPENVLMMPEGQLIISGLGWGRLMTTLLRRGVLGGDKDKKNSSERMAYFAPEQIEEADGFDFAADLYAIGAILFEMVTGQVPKPGQLPSQFNSNAPAFANDLCKRCLHQRPLGRHANLEELITSLVETQFEEADPNDTLRERSTPGVKESSAASIVARQSETFPAPGFRSIQGAKFSIPMPSLSSRGRTEDTDPDSGTMAKAAEEERPKIELSSSDFAISQHLVSAQAFAYYLRDTNPASLEKHVRLDEFSTIVADGGQIIPRRGLANFPINQVSHFGALAYCAWLSERLGAECRLPTLAEWMTAAGAADGRPYPWGNSLPTPDRACFQRRWCDMSYQVMVPVETLAQGSSPSGVLQMSGTVWEWTSDTASIFGEALLAELEDKAGQNGANGTARPVSNGLADFKAGEVQVICGGSWFDEPEELRLDAIRLLPANYRRVTVGFRVAAPADFAQRFMAPDVFPGLDG